VDVSQCCSVSELISCNTAAVGTVSSSDPAARIPTDNSERPSARGKNSLDVQPTKAGRNRGRLLLWNRDSEPVDGVVDQLPFFIKRCDDAEQARPLVSRCRPCEGQRFDVH